MEVLQKGSPANRAVAAALAVVLAIGLMPLPAYATTATGGETSAANNAAATGGDSAESGTAPTEENSVGASSSSPAGEAGTIQPGDGSGASTPATGTVENGAGSTETPAAPETTPDPAQQQRDEAFTAGWESGAWVISEPGTYKLTRDITTPGMLTIIAPAGQAITLDFDGHTATVAGHVYAGIDAGASLGSVVVTDSAYEKRAAEARAKGQDAPAPQANLVVEGYKATTAIVGVQANYAQLTDEQKADPAVAGAKPALSIRGVGISASVMTADAAAPADVTYDAYAVYAGLADKDDPRKGIDAQLSDVSLTAKVENVQLSAEDAAKRLADEGDAPLAEAQSGVAYGLYAATADVRLDGWLSADLASANNTCALYAAKADTFTFGAALAPQGTLRVWSQGNAAHAAFATAEKLPGEDALAHFEDATGAGMALVVEDGLVAFAAPDGAQQAEEAAEADSAPDEQGAGEEAQDAQPEPLALVAATSLRATEMRIMAEEATEAIETDDNGPWQVGESRYATFDLAQQAAAAVYAAATDETKPESVTMKLVAYIADQSWPLDIGGYSNKTAPYALFAAGESGQSYVIDLNGYYFGGVASTSPADLTVTSNGGTAVLEGFQPVDTESDAGWPDLHIGKAGDAYSIVHAGAGTMTVTADVKVDMAKPAEKAAYPAEAKAISGTGLLSCGAGKLVVRATSISVDGTAGEGAAGAAYGIHLAGAGSVEVTSTPIIVAKGDGAGGSYGIASDGAGSITTGQLDATAENPLMAYGAYASAGSVSVKPSSYAASHVLYAHATEDDAENVRVAAAAATGSGSVSVNNHAVKAWAGKLSGGSNISNYKNGVDAYALKLDGAQATLALGGQVVVNTQNVGTPAVPSIGVKGGAITLESTFSPGNNKYTLWCDSLADGAFAKGGENATSEQLAGWASAFSGYAVSRYEGPQAGYNVLADGTTLKIIEAQDPVLKPGSGELRLAAGNEQAVSIEYSGDGDLNVVTAGTGITATLSEDKTSVTVSASNAVSGSVTISASKTARYNAAKAAVYVVAMKGNEKKAIVYDLNGGSGHAQATLADWASSEGTQSITLAGATGLTPPKEGQVLVGWASSKDDANKGTAAYGVGETVPAESQQAEAFTGLFKDGYATLYAVWKDAVSVTFHAQDASGNAVKDADGNDVVCVVGGLTPGAAWPSTDAKYNVTGITAPSGYKTIGWTTSSGQTPKAADYDTTVGNANNLKNDLTYLGSGAGAKLRKGPAVSGGSFATWTCPEKDLDVYQVLQVVPAVEIPTLGEGEENDLYKLLTDVDSGDSSKRAPKTGTVTLGKQGTYVLSHDMTGDLAAKASELSITAAGDIVIDLQGHTLAFADESSGIKVSGNGSRTLAINGGMSAAGEKGALEFGAKGSLSVTSATSLKLSGLSAKNTLTESSQGTNEGLRGPVVFSNVADVEITGCDITLDGTKSRLTGQLASALRVGTANTVVRLVDSTITSKGTAPSEGVGAHAVALNVSAKATVDITNCELVAEASKGQATALFAKGSGAQITLGGDAVKLASTSSAAGGYSVGIMAQATKSGGKLTADAVALNTIVEYSSDSSDNVAPIAVGTSANHLTDASAAPVVLGAGFSATQKVGSGSAEAKLGVLTSPTVATSGFSGGSDVPAITGESDADKEKDVVARVAEGADGQGALAQLTWDSAKTGVKLGLFDSVIAFEKDYGEGATPQVALYRDDKELGTFMDVAAAIERAQGGDTLKLLKDVDGTASIDYAALEGTVTVDLAGHKLGYLNVGSETKADIAVMSSADGAAIVGGSVTTSTKQSSKYGILQEGSGTVAVRGVPLTLEQGADESLTGSMEAVRVSNQAGTVALEGSPITVTALDASEADGVYASKGTATLVGSDVTVSRSGAASSGAVYGVRAMDGAKNSYGNVTCEGSDVVVSGSAKTVAAAYVNKANSATGGATITITGTESKPMPQVTAKDVNGATEAYAVRVANAPRKYGSSHKDNHVTLDGCAVSVSYVGAVPEGADVQDCRLGDDKETLTLAGTCSFSHPLDDAGTHIYHKGAPLIVAGDFALASDGLQKLRVFSDELTDSANNVFAQGADRSARSRIADIASLFEPAEDAKCKYVGYAVGAKNSDIWWSDAKLADAFQIGTVKYKTLGSALNAASAGATIEALALEYGAVYSGDPVTVTKAVTLDLKGNAVRLACGSPDGAAVSVKAGSLKVTDSTQGKGGKLALECEAPASGGGDMAGLDVASGASLTIDGATVAVAMAGGSADSLSGVRTESATPAGESLAAVNVLNGGRLKVESATGELANTDASAGAKAVRGIAVAGGAKDALAVLVEAGSTVSAHSRTASYEAGQIYGSDVNESYADVTTSGESALNGARIREIDPAADSQLWQETCERFRVVARYDAGTSSESGSGSVYGSRIYWAAPMQVASGAYVWAFSKPVAPEDRDKPELIVPEKAYVQTTYRVKPPAYGIWAAESAAMKGIVRVSGSVEAASDHGDAYAVGAGGGKDAVWELDGATLRAEAQGESAPTLQSHAPAIKDALGIVSADMEWDGFFPKSSDVREVAVKDPMAAGVYQPADKSLVEKSDRGYPSVSLAGKLAIELASRSPYGIVADEFKVGEGFAAQSAVTVADHDLMASAGTVFARALDAEKPVTAAQAALLADATGQSKASLADGGKALMWGSPCSVRFVDYYGTTVKTVENAYDGQEIELPDAGLVARADTRTKSYPLAGWSTDAKATADSESLVKADAGTVTVKIPKGSTDEVVYRPVYAETARAATLTFTGAYDADGHKIADVTLEAGVNAPLSGYAESLAGVPAAADRGTRVFVGWRALVLSPGSSMSNVNNVVPATRIIDKDDVGNFAPIYPEMTLTAEYVDVPQGYQLVVFKVDDHLFPYAVPDGVRPTWSAATSASRIYDAGAAPSKAATDGRAWDFKGYASGRHDVSAGSAYPDANFKADGSDLPAAVGGNAKAFYTATFSAGALQTTRVSLWFYYHWTSGSDQWQDATSANSTSRQRTVSYGADIYDFDDAGLADLKGNPVSYVTAAGTAPDVSYTSHEFIGWSTRQGDLAAIPPSLLPKAGQGISNYYAVYKTGVMADVVKLVVAGDDGAEEVVWEGELPSNGSLGQVIADEKYAEPSKPGKYFLGWADTPDGTAVQTKGEGDEAVEETVSSIQTNYDTVFTKSRSHVAPTTGDGKFKGEVTYYAQFSDVPPAVVTMHGQGSDFEDMTFKAGKGSRLADLDNYTAPTKAGYAFTGWNMREDGEGGFFDVRKDTVESDELELWAQFEELGAGSLAADVSVDTAAASLSSAGALESEKPSVSVRKVNAVDAGMELSGRVKVIQPYDFAVTVTRDGSKIELTEELSGTVRITVPLPDEYDGKDVYLYALEPDGTVNAHKAIVEGGLSAQASGAMTTQAASGLTARANIPATAASNAGNVVLAWRMNDLEYAQAQAAEKLDAVYESYRESDYSASDWAALGEALAAGKQAIAAAATAEGAQAAAQAASDAMADVPSKADLANAKYQDLQKLAAAFAGYDKDKYSEDEWKYLTGSYEQAMQLVNDAATVADANRAASDGILSMADAVPLTDQQIKERDAANPATSGASGGTSAVSTGTATRLTSTSSGTASGSSGSSGLTNTASSLGSKSSTANAAADYQKGGATYSLLGASLVNYEESLSGKYDTPMEEAAVYVDSLGADSSLAKAGIQEGDCIVAVDGKDVKTIYDIQEALAGKKAGDEVDFRVMARDGKYYTYTVTLTADDEKAIEDAVAAMAVTATGASTFGSNGLDGGDGADGLSDTAGNGGIGGWIAGHLPLFIVLCIIVAAAVAGLVWWLARRRAGGADDDDDFWADDMAGAAAGA